MFRVPIFIQLARAFSKRAAWRRLCRFLKQEQLRYRQYKSDHDIARTAVLRHINPGGVTVWYWDASGRSSVGNIGDILSPIICESITRKLCNVDINETARRVTVLYAVGTVLTTATADGVVWGSGFDYGLRPFSTLDPQEMQLDIRAVRGPLTAAFMRSYGYTCPDIYGDPAVLMPYVYKPRHLNHDIWYIADNKQEVGDQNKALELSYRKVLVIQHILTHNIAGTLGIEISQTPKTIKQSTFSAWRSAATLYGNNKIIFTSAWTDNWREWIDVLASADIVISTALHGIILAEAYGIPAIHLVDGDVNAAMKFDDYYLSTGRVSHAKASSLQEALTQMAPILPDLENLRQQLLDTFPTDLWEG